jgi:hypothetical protein
MTISLSGSIKIGKTLFKLDGSTVDWKIFLPFAVGGNYRSAMLVDTILREQISPTSHFSCVLDLARVTEYMFNYA